MIISSMEHPATGGIQIIPMRVQTLHAPVLHTWSTLFRIFGSSSNCPNGLSNLIQKKGIEISGGISPLYSAVQAYIANGTAALLWLYTHTHTLYIRPCIEAQKSYTGPAAVGFSFPNVCGRSFYFALRRVEEENIMKTDKGDDNRSSVKRLAELSPFNIYSVFLLSLIAPCVCVLWKLTQINGDRSQYHRRRELEGFVDHQQDELSISIFSFFFFFFLSEVPCQSLQLRLEV